MTEFNDDLLNHKLYQIEKNRLALIHEHFTKLKALIMDLESKKVFLPVDDGFKFEVVTEN